MQYLKIPFYYNKKILNIFIFQKIINYQCYSKFIYYYQNRNLIDIKTIFLKKQKTIKFKKNQNQNNISKKIEIVSSDTFFDTFSGIEYIDDDFFYCKLKQFIPGFSLNLKEKYFFNLKVLNYDFKEKYFHFKITKNYLNLVYKTFNKLYSINNKYKTIIPLKAVKGGYIIIGFGVIGFLPLNHITYIKKNSFNFFFNKKKNFLPLIPFFFSSLHISWYFEKKNKKLFCFIKSYVYFFKKKLLLK